MRIAICERAEYCDEKFKRKRSNVVVTEHSETYGTIAVMKLLWIIYRITSIHDDDDADDECDGEYACSDGGPNLAT